MGLGCSYVDRLVLGLRVRLGVIYPVVPETGGKSRAFDP
jgi:hypothetical protein